MNWNPRQAIWVLALGVGISVFGAPAVAAAYQPQDERGHDRQDRDRDRGHDQQDRDKANNAAAQEGMRHGQDDRAHNRTAQYHRRPANDAERRAYESSYDRAYNRRGWNGRNNNGRDGDRNNNGRYGNGGYGNNGQYGVNDARSTASQTGSQDGRNDGMTDRRTGHSFRPTQGDNYKSGGRAYNTSFGDRTQYKQMYRQAYVPAYQQGYYRQP